MKYVSYINKNHIRTNYLLSNALESNNKEMKKRLIFTKEIMN
jgi:hypothetical protein